MKHLSTVLLLAGLALSGVGCLKTPSFGDKSDSEAPFAASGEADSAPIFVKWNRISEAPPTFFPEGLPSNASTTSQDGEWFQRDGARYFVPFRAAGLPEYADIVNSVPEGSDGSQSRVGEFASHLDPRKLIPGRDKSDEQTGDSPASDPPKSDGVRTDSIWKAES